MFASLANRHPEITRIKRGRSGKEFFILAARLIQYDEKESLAILDVEKPQISKGKILVEVHKAGVNPVDWKTRSGDMPAPLPITLGGDFAGVVVEVGPGVSGFKPGDRIFGYAGYFSGGSGSFAEYDLVEAGRVAAMPESVSETEAGAMPLVGVMALQAITEVLELSAGQKILIQGGAGGIGSVAIQIARHVGAFVSTTCTADQFDYVKSLGADQAIDYQSEKFEDLVHEYDAVYDLVGGDVYQRSFQVLKQCGMIVSTVEPPDLQLMEKYQVTAIIQSSQVTTKRLTKLTRLVDAGVIKMHVEKTFPLRQANDAMTYQEKFHPKGKAVIDVK